VTARNHSVFQEGPVKEKLLREAMAFDSEDPSVLFDLGEILLKRQKPEGRILLKECVNLLEPKLKGNYIRPYDLNILIYAATLLDEEDILEQAEQIRDAQQKTSKTTQIYTDGNLVKSLTENLPVKRG
jgi:hypothetical protein